jgi:hypothetical protein
MANMAGLSSVSKGVCNGVSVSVNASASASVSASVNANANSSASASACELVEKRYRHLTRFRDPIEESQRRVEKLLETCALGASKSSTTTTTSLSSSPPQSSSGKRPANSLLSPVSLSQRMVIPSPVPFYSHPAAINSHSTESLKSKGQSQRGPRQDNRSKAQLRTLVQEAYEFITGSSATRFK